MERARTVMTAVTAAVTATAATRYGSGWLPFTPDSSSSSDPMYTCTSRMRHGATSATTVGPTPIAVPSTKHRRDTCRQAAICEASAAATTHDDIHGSTCTPW